MYDEISFVNESPYPCGCSASFSDGNGEYSDVITVKLCEKHKPSSNPKEDAEKAGFYLSAAGTWVNSIDMLFDAVYRNLEFAQYDTAWTNLQHLQKAVEAQRNQ